MQVPTYILLASTIQASIRHESIYTTPSVERGHNVSQDALALQKMRSCISQRLADADVPPFVCRSPDFVCLLTRRHNSSTPSYDKEPQVYSGPAVHPALSTWANWLRWCEASRPNCHRAFWWHCNLWNAPTYSVLLCLPSTSSIALNALYSATRIDMTSERIVWCRRLHRLSAIASPWLQ